MKVHALVKVFLAMLHCSAFGYLFNFRKFLSFTIMPVYLGGNPRTALPTYPVMCHLPPLFKFDARIFVHFSSSPKFYVFLEQVFSVSKILFLLSDMQKYRPLKVAYSDEDGTASKESETIYWYRVRTLLSLNSILSVVGCTLAALRGEYRGESMLWGLLIFWSRLLWASSFHRKLSIILIIAAKQDC